MTPEHKAAADRVRVYHDQWREFGFPTSARSYQHVADLKLLADEAMKRLAEDAELARRRQEPVTKERLLELGFHADGVYMAYLSCDGTICVEVDTSECPCRVFINEYHAKMVDTMGFLIDLVNALKGVTVKSNEWKSSIDRVRLVNSGELAVYVYPYAALPTQAYLEDCVSLAKAYIARCDTDVTVEKMKAEPLTVEWLDTVLVRRYGEWVNIDGITG